MGKGEGGWWEEERIIPLISGHQHSDSYYRTQADGEGALCLEKLNTKAQCTVEL